MAEEAVFHPYRPRELLHCFSFSTIVGLIMLGFAAFCLAALAWDARHLAGEPVWLKPLKFALSAALYLLTFPWLLAHLEGFQRFRRLAIASGTVLVLIEVTLISVQAARGIRSHFNCLTVLDCSIYTTMGIAVTLLWTLQLVSAVILLRQRFSEPVLGWSLRFALILAVLAGAVGWMMCYPSSAQRAAQRAGRLTLSGAHTVGGADGGRGLPLTSWSLDHGDLRVPHFVGLHGLQALPVAGVLVSRRKRLSRNQRLRLVLLAGGSYFLLFASLLALALAGASLASPWTAVTLGVLMAATGGAALVVMRRRTGALGSRGGGGLRVIEGGLSRSAELPAVVASPQGDADATHHAGQGPDREVERSEA
jgi:hypothetical protein